MYPVRTVDFSGQHLRSPSPAEPGRAKRARLRRHLSVLPSDRSADDFASVRRRETRAPRLQRARKSPWYAQRMASVSVLSDSDLIARLPALVGAERNAIAVVIEHLAEMERRRLYLEHATFSLYRYCIERLGYSEDAALKRHRVARLALRFPRVLEELRAGTIHLTGLFLLSAYLTEENAEALVAAARGKSRRQIDELIARWFPRPDVPPRIEAAAVDSPRTDHPGLRGVDQRTLGQKPIRPTCPETGNPAGSGRVEPLSPSRYRVEFTARAELRDKLERARELLSHAVASGDLGELFERALDALIEKETRQRLGAGRPRKRRGLREGSRHIPVETRGQSGSAIRVSALSWTPKGDAAANAVS
jgi:hypothetical protein